MTAMLRTAALTHRARPAQFPLSGFAGEGEWRR
jgi:hypothetical protein